MSISNCGKLLAGLALLAVAAVGIAQQATIQRSSNLRKSPSAESDILDSLASGDSVALTSPRKNAGYYHVKTSAGKSGWVWGKNVKITGATPPTPAAVSESCSAPAFPAGAAPIDSLSCGLEGSGGKEAAQNSAKNNFCATGSPRSIAIQDLVDLQKKVESDTSIPFGKAGSHPAGPATDRSPLEALGERSEVVLTGFVKLARQEGAESVNCEKNVPDQPAYHDIHISIVSQPDDAECSGVVAEMIPHHRPDTWTPALVNKVSAARLPVRMTGNLMFDSSHSPCKNGAAHSGDPSRASLWEVHPIYKFEVCTKSDCSSGEGWVPLESWQRK